MIESKMLADKQLLCNACVTELLTLLNYQHTWHALLNFMAF